MRACGEIIAWWVEFFGYEDVYIYIWVYKYKYIYKTALWLWSFMSQNH